MDIEKRIQELHQRLQYIRDIFGDKENANISLLESKLQVFDSREKESSTQELARQLHALEDLFQFLEKKLDKVLTPMDRVRIVRHPFRICLKDILEHVYDNYTEIGGQDECSIDPSMLIARAYITRRVGEKVYHQPVMVIGQEKGHGQDFRNGGSVKPWGNAKALHYMRVAEIENIPIHTYIFTPGSFPIEDFPGAAQQIARNIYEMGGLKVPIVSVISEGGSGGAEAIGLGDIRLMLSHGYYSVISPEGAAAIEGRLRDGARATPELIEKCARQLKIIAKDNFEMGLIDRVVQEPPLGARPNHYGFYKQLRDEVVRATDEIVLQVRGMKMLRFKALSKRKTGEVFVRWNLNSSARDKLIWNRYQKYRSRSRNAYIDPRKIWEKSFGYSYELGWSVFSYMRYDVFGKHQKRFAHFVEDMGAEFHVLRKRVGTQLARYTPEVFKSGNESAPSKELTELSSWNPADYCADDKNCYVSPRAKEDRSVTCPNSEQFGCLDQWAPDLFGEWAGVCSYCGHHFPMEYQWYLHNLFDPGSIHEFNRRIEAGNPLSYEGLDLKLSAAKK
ncbi:MAG: acetyl-CoA carboxylase carboxyl transferase subunit alpha/beta, partial [Desulfovibrionales bacterium]